MSYIGKYKHFELGFVLLLVISFALLGTQALAAEEEPNHKVWNYSDYVEATGNEIEEFNEAPQLAAKVEEGALPPVEERLPANPLLIEPWEKVGKYGGTWNRLSTSEDWPFVRMTMYGLSLVRWVKDGLGKAPGLLTSWEANEDKSSWTLHFREGIKWSDGEPFTADDVLFWWEDMVLDEGHSSAIPVWARSGGETMEVVKLDDYTLRWDYAGPQPLLPGYLANWPNGGLGHYVVVPGHYLKQFHPKYNEEVKDYETMEEKQEWWRNPDSPVLTAWNPVMEEAGKRLVLQRNPYYYAVDPAGNQLPYVDEVDVRFVTDPEVFKLKAAQGESDMHIHPGTLNITDISLLKQNEQQHNFRTLMWTSGAGGETILYPNQNHPDPEKRELYRNHKFLMALSHAINREKIRKMVFYQQGELTTGTFSPNAIEYHRTEEGREIYKEWRDLAVEYDPEKSKRLLDELGVVDQDGDGWRDMPSGKELKLRIDFDSEAAMFDIDSSEITKQDFRKVGLKTISNPVDGSKLGTMNTQATFDIRNSWECGDGPDHLVYPHWLVPVAPHRWAPLYGAWYQVQDTDKAGTELDKDPRDRRPPRKKPSEGSPYRQLQKLYDKAIVAPTWQERDRLVREMVKVHIEHGPYMISMGPTKVPRVGVASNNFKNVPHQEELAQGGFVTPWIMAYPAITSTEQYYFENPEEE